MKRFIPLLLIAAVLFAADVSMEDSTLYVTGRASILVLPDAAAAEFGIEIREIDVENITTLAHDMVASIAKEFGKAGIDQPIIQQGPADIYTELNWESQRVEYVYGLRLNCAVDDLSKVDKLLGILASASSKTEGSRISSYTINYFVKDPEQYVEKLHEMAMTDAKAQAQKAASAHGLKLGELKYSSQSEPFTGYMSVWDPYTSWDFDAEDLGGKSTLPRVALGYEISATFKLVE